MPNVHNAGKSIVGNLTGSKPTDLLGDVIHGIRGFLQTETKADPNPATARTPYHVVAPPKDAAGETPENYQPSNEDLIKSILSGKEGTKGLLGLGIPDKTLEAEITDKEFEQLQKESANGNQLAMNLLDAYRPKYGPTAQQFEQSMVDPFVKQLQALPGDVQPLLAQQEALVPSVSSAIGEAQSMAESNIPGFTPQSPNAQTQGLMDNYANISSDANIAADLSPMSKGLSDLAHGAAISEKTFPEQNLVQDLLNRYAYQVQSPSYSPATANYQNLPPYIRDLFAASTGVKIGGGSTTPNIGLPDMSGISVPSLTPAGAGANPSGY